QSRFGSSVFLSPAPLSLPILFTPSPISDGPKPCCPFMSPKKLLWNLFLNLAPPFGIHARSLQARCCSYAGGFLTTLPTGALPPASISAKDTRKKRVNSSVP